MAYFNRMIENVEEDEIVLDLLKDAGVIARISPECVRCFNRDMTWQVAPHNTWSCFW